MAAPRISRFLVAPCVALAAGLLDVRAAAPPPRENLPINIEAVSIEGDIRNNSIVYHGVTISQGDLRIRAEKASVVGGLNYQNSKWTFSGGVRINAEGGSLQSDAAVVTFANKVITRAVITGAPAEFEAQREDGAQPARGHAKTIDYETTSGTVSLQDEAWLSDGCSEIRGEKLVYNIRSQSVQAQSQAAASDGSGRVHITILPHTSSGAPCNPPGTKPP